MAKPRWVIAGKELSGVFTERTILLAVVIQVVVAGFSSFLVVGLSALVDPSAFPGSTQARLAITPEVQEDALLMSRLADQRFQIIESPNGTEALTLFRRGGVDGALFLQPLSINASDGSLTPATVSVILPEADLRTTLTLTQVKAALEAYERDLRTRHEARLVFEPIYVQNDAKAGSYAFVYSLLIPLLVFLPVVLSGALCADSLTEEVQRKTLPMLLASPATPADVVEGKLLANVAVAPLLASAWFLLLALNKLPVPLLGALGILLLSTAIAYLLGLLACAIALATRDRNKAHVTYASAMFLLLALSMALPTSPVNAVALLAAGSADASAWLVVLGFVGAALAGSIALHLGLRRSAQWMAAGTA